MRGKTARSLSALRRASPPAFVLGVPPLILVTSSPKFRRAGGRGGAARLVTLNAAAVFATAVMPVVLSYDV